MFGKAGNFGSAISLASLDGANGFRLDGIVASDNSGRSVSGAGDLNGDGYDDLVIGAPTADPGGLTNAGQAYVVFGRASGFTLNDSELSNVFTSSRIVVGAANSGDVTFNAPLSLLSNDTLEIVTGGTVNDTDNGTAFTGLNLAITAAQGIGTTGALNTGVSNLVANGGSGGVNVSNAGSLTIGGVPSQLFGVSTTAGYITITASSPLTVNQDVTNFGSGNVTLTAAGTVTPGTGQLTFVDFEQDAVNGVDGLAGADDVVVSPGGKHVYVTGPNDDAIAVFSRDSLTGELTFVSLERQGFDNADGLDVARKVTISPDGAHVYVTGAASNAVAVFSRDAGTGDLTFVEVEKDGVGGVDGLLTAYGVTVSPDGQHVYVTGNSDDALAVFSRNAVTGELTFVEFKQDGVGSVDGLNAAREVIVSPDGNHVYVAGYDDDAVAVFSRNTMTGVLTFVEVQQNGVASVDGLDGVSGISISPDGNYVYTASEFGDAVAVFSRNSSTGQLTFVEFQADGVGGVEGLDGSHSVSVSPDGNHVYVASLVDDAVAVFSRDAQTGSLAFVEVLQDGINLVDGLNGAKGVTVSPDGNHVYVASIADNAVAVFSRDNGSSGVPTDDLTINANVSGGAGSVSLNAASDVVLTHPVTTTGGEITINADSNADGDGNFSQQSQVINNPVTFFPGTTYLSQADIHAGLYDGGSPTFLEDFELGMLGGGIVASDGFVQAASISSDSVDLDDGLLD